MSTRSGARREEVIQPFGACVVENMGGSDELAMFMEFAKLVAAHWALSGLSLLLR